MKRGPGGDPETNGTEVSAVLTFDDILCLSNCINETVGFVDDFEFATRVGITKEFARQLGGKLHELIVDVYR